MPTRTLAISWAMGGILAAAAACAPATTYPATRVRNESLACEIDYPTGQAGRIRSLAPAQSCDWLAGPVRVTVRNEVTGRTESPVQTHLTGGVNTLTVDGRLAGLGLALRERWAATPSCITWDLSFTGQAKDSRTAGHEVAIELLILSKGRLVFTPTERGVMSVAAYPTHRPMPYGHMGWGSHGACYVLPLVSVFDAGAGAALTIALPPDANIPHLQVEWEEGKVLRLRLGNRGMGGAKPSVLSLRLYAHPCDYRSVLKAYSDDFPRYFQPPLPRSAYEGAFWYHHIQDHPSFEEMARQHVRYIWSSFWFSHLGEYLPDAKEETAGSPQRSLRTLRGEEEKEETAGSPPRAPRTLRGKEEKEWYPYTYARSWKLGQKMSDERILAFARELRAHGIGTYAYFNLTEYGGAGGQHGDDKLPARKIRTQFAPALYKGADGRPVSTWEGSVVMNPGRELPYREHLREQVRRHLKRLPDIQGFVIDRLDWASRYDYGRHDGLTMVKDRPAENMALPVGDAVRDVCDLAHRAGKRVFVNQFWRVDVLADVDGYCHEFDYVCGLGYLAPYRPASAWHQAVGYRGDLLAFEAQLKRRLQFAVLPQMIAHEFPISQQPPDARAADLLEIHAPLFSALIGKRQVLAADCVAASGPNDANLFVNARGHYVVPVTSRVRFLSRGCRAAGPVEVVLRVPDAAAIKWAHVYSADVPPYRAKVAPAAGFAIVRLGRHGTSSVAVVGGGAEPELPADDESIADTRRRLAPLAEPGPVTQPAAGPPPADVAGLTLRIRGVHVGAPGPVSVLVGDCELGKLGSQAVWELPPPEGGKFPAQAPALVLAPGDEGTWFVPQRAELLARDAKGGVWRVAQWTPEAPFPKADGPFGGPPVEDAAPRLHAGPLAGRIELPLRWCAATKVVPSTAQFVGTDTSSAAAGRWVGRLGARAAWIPHVTQPPGTQDGYRLTVDTGQPFTWDKGAPDARALQAPTGSAGPARATCWFHEDQVALSVETDRTEPYRLTLYVLDFDRNGRSQAVTLRDDLKQLDRQEVSAAEAAKGAYLTWTVTGPVRVEVTKRKGYNVVLSGVFIDLASPERP